MIDFDVLKAFGTTNERLKELFTVMPQTDVVIPKGETKEQKRDRIAKSRQIAQDVELREKIRRRDQTRIEEGIVKSMKHWRLYAAVDLAWDSTVITKMTLPLMLYAQSKVNVERAVQMLGNIKDGEKYIKKGEGDKLTVDVPKFVETNVNLVRSIISRRHAAQKNKYNQLWPYYKYESRSTGLPGKCRADVLSQRVDMMVDQFDYRHHDSQVMRDGFLYAHSLDFIRSSWEVEKQYVRKSLDGDPKDVEAVITKEGVGWFNPHPSRVFADRNYPLASINTDTGVEWLGFWDVMRYGDIEDNPYYFNKTQVGWTGRFWGNVYDPYRDYFSHYQYTVMPPYSGAIDPSKDNDRKAVTGMYAGNQRDASVFVTNYFEKIVPKDWKVGEYPWPVWVRKVIASDSTTIFAEFLPSTPAAYLGINENDSREVNVSMAMELFSAQDQMSNLLTHLLLVCQIELFKVFGINTDVIPEANLAAIRSRLKGENWWSEPLVVEYSLAKLEAMGIKVDQAIHIVETRQSGTINSIFEAMVKLVELTEKLMALSPAEQGQPAPREISATEVNEIASTTSAIYSSVSEDIDEYRAAKKRIVYESLIACSKGNITCPVKDRYTEKTIRAAGFEPKEGEDEVYTSTNVKGRSIRTTVIGSTRKLVHDYIFTTRDGSERPVNTQAANTLVQLIGQVMSVPMVAQALGKEKLYELFNEVFRMSGAGVDLNLSLKEGEDDTLGEDEMTQLKQTLDQITQALNQLAGQVSKTAQDVADQEQVNAQQEDAIKGLTELADRVKTMAEDVSELHSKHEEINKRLIESINYKDAPDPIKRQMEASAGFKPAFGATSPSDKKPTTQKA